MGKPIVFWPSWRYHPTEGGKIFQSPEEVPVGWYETPGEAEEAADTSKAPLEDGPDAWAGHSKKDLIAALRKVPGEKVHAGTSARKLFERAVEVGALAGYGPTD